MCSASHKGWATCTMLSFFGVGRGRRGGGGGAKQTKKQPTNLLHSGVRRSLLSIPLVIATHPLINERRYLLSPLRARRRRYDGGLRCRGHVSPPHYSVQGSCLIQTAVTPLRGPMSVLLENSRERKEEARRGVEEAETEREEYTSRQAGRHAGRQADRHPE